MSATVKHQALDELVRIKLQQVELQAKMAQLEAIILGDTAKPTYGELASRILKALDHPMSTREIADACNDGGYGGTYAALKHTDSRLSRIVHRLPDGRWVKKDVIPAEKTPPSPPSVPAKGMSERLSAIQKQRYASAKANPSGLTDRQQACLDAVKQGATTLAVIQRAVGLPNRSGMVYGLLQSLIKRGLITKNRWHYAVKL